MKFAQSIDLISLLWSWHFAYSDHIDQVRSIGDVTAIRKDKKGRTFRRNYERAMLMMAVAWKYGSTKFLEFGTGRGFVTACLSTNDIISSITTIDKLDSEKTQRKMGELDGVNMSKIHFIRKNSFKIDASELSNDFDLVFIDGEHSQMAVKNDFDIALHSTTDNAIIVFDDCRNKHKGVKKFIKSLNYDKILVYTDGWIYENTAIAKHGDADKVVDGKEVGSGQVILYKGGLR